MEEGERMKALRLVCWNAKGFQSRKLELHNSEHGINVWYLNKAQINTVYLGWVAGLAECVCRTFVQSRLTDTVYLGVNKAFDTVWL
jgi:hypothetical protein